MEFMKKFQIQYDCKISIYVHHWYYPQGRGLQDPDL